MTLKKGSNMNKKLISLIAGVAIVAAATGCSQTATSSVAGTSSEASSTATEELSGTLSMNGSTSMEKVIKAVNGAFMEKNKGVTVNLNLTGSGTGIQEASEGKCDIGNSSRKLKDEEAEKLDATVVGLDGIALVVNPVNKLEDISLENLAKVYSGEITNWKELGGDDKAIVVIGREDGSGTRDGFESITGTSDSCKYRQELTSTGDVITTVSSNPGAIGYASLAAVKDTVKKVSVDGVEATEETVKDGSYKVQRPFVLVTKDGTELSEAAQAFFDYVTSKDAADIISAAGAVAVAE